MNIRELDLNLLLALDRLLDFGNVSQAAADLGVTQPAMSNILARLRRTLDDPILVKTGRQMQATPKAARLRPALRHIIEKIQSEILDPKEFDPSRDRHHFKLALHDYEQLVLYAQLLPRLLRLHPGMTLEHIVPRHSYPTEDLVSGDADFATGPVVPDRAGIMRLKLFKDDFVCLADRRHCRLRKLDVDSYVDLEHIFIAPHGGMSGQVDLALARTKRSRNVRLSVAEFSVTPWLILGTPLMVTIPRRAATVFAEHHRDLVIYECPVSIPPVEIFLTWHERLNASKPHQWMKELLIQSVTDT